MPQQTNGPPMPWRQTCCRQRKKESKWQTHTVMCLRVAWFWCPHGLTVAQIPLHVSRGKILSRGFMMLSATRIILGSAPCASNWVPAPVMTLRSLTMVQNANCLKPGFRSVFSPNGQIRGAKFIGICKPASFYFNFIRRN